MACISAPGLWQQLKSVVQRAVKGSKPHSSSSHSSGKVAAGHGTPLEGSGGQETGSFQGCLKLCYKPRSHCRLGA